MRCWLALCGSLVRGWASSASGSAAAPRRSRASALTPKPMTGRHEQDLRHVGVEVAQPPDVRVDARLERARRWQVRSWRTGMAEELQRRADVRRGQALR